MRAHESECFRDASGLAPDEMDTYNLVTGIPSLSLIRRHQAVLIGGSGDFYVSKRDLPRFPEFLELLLAIIDCGHPTFASCFGYHCIVTAMGGQIIHDPDNTEVGTYELSLTDEGRNDPLFTTLPGTFAAQMGHKDRASCHPEGLMNFAYSERSPLQALRIPGKPIWGAQFHPELSGTQNQERYLHYLEGYAQYQTEEDRAEHLTRFRESPEATKLLSKFLQLARCG